jgi:serine/threonine protein kinase
MPLDPGRLSHYRLLGEIGRGGMGVVWKAEDTTLGRLVAIKILPDDVARSPERLARFEREARLLASLNHPHVAQIHSLEEEQGVRFLVLEMVEGQTLQELMNRGPMSLDATLRIAEQVARGLEAAHGSGVIHRDIKPSNIKVTPAGQVKLLDFGLAKNWAPSSEDSSEGLTLSRSLTEAGAVMGTAAYMSPEQWRGRSVDKRADIWAFGCVLYEMLTGCRPFRAETGPDLSALVLTREPDWDALPSPTPPTVVRLLRRCLCKDPENRLHDIADARIEIEEALGQLSTATTEAPEEPRRGRGPSSSLLRAVVAVTLGVLLGALGASFLPSARILRQRHRTPVRLQRLTEFVGLEETPALSPDKKSVAFSAPSGGSRQIWVRLLSGGSALQITDGPSDHVSPRWAPDSSSLIYFSPAAGGGEGTIFEVSALGGTPRRLVASVSDADLSPDGRTVAYFRLGQEEVELAVASRDGSGARSVAALSRGYDYVYPRWSPDGESIAFERYNGQISFSAELTMVSSSGGEPRRIWVEPNYVRGLAWLPGGSGLLFSSPRGDTMAYLPTSHLWTVSLEGRDLEQLTFGEDSYVDPDVTASGIVVAGRRRLTFDLWTLPADGTPQENVRRGVRLTHGTGRVTTPWPAPGDRSLAYLSDSGGHANIWVMDLASGKERPVTFETDPAVLVGLPVWSPDGKHIAFYSEDTRPGGLGGVWLVDPDGSQRRYLARGAWAEWSPDSRWLYYGAQREGRFGIDKIRAEGGEPVQVRTDNAISPVADPDGQTLFYVVPDVAAMQIRVARPPSGPSELLATIPGSRVAPEERTNLQPSISPDGRWLAFMLSGREGSNLWAMPAGGGPLRRLTDFGDRHVQIVRRVSWSSDARSLFVAMAEDEEDVVLIEHLLP